jgi:hypothetical protein
MFEYWQEHKDERIDQLKASGYRLTKCYKIWCEQGRPSKEERNKS